MHNPQGRKVSSKAGVRYRQKASIIGCTAPWLPSGGRRGICHRQQKNKLSGVRGKQILAHPLVAHCLRTDPRKNSL